MEYREIDDSHRGPGPSRSGPPTPPDLAALRAGKTIFWSADVAKRRMNSVWSCLRRDRRNGIEDRRLATRTSVVDGVPGVVAWLLSENDEAFS